MSTDFKKIKTAFPFFETHPKMAYLDNASTTQICAPALDAINKYYLENRANVHRAVYDVAANATEDFEKARKNIARFINCENEEVVFTSGTTHGLNLLAYTLGPQLTHRDNVVLTRLEHHANLVPWQEMARHYGFEIRFIELDGSSIPPLRGVWGCSQSSIIKQHSQHPPEPPSKGEFAIDIESVKKVIDKNTKIVSFALASNVLGTVAPASEIIEEAKAVGAITIIDAAQAVAHMPIDVKKFDCDFLVFSGHKMYGPTGIGVLYGKKELLEERMEPFFFGGEMVKEVTYKKAQWNDLPYKFEAGTPDIAGAIGLGAAALFIEKIGWKNISKHEGELTEYALEKLGTMVTVFGPNTDNCHSESERRISGSPNVERTEISLRDPAGFRCAQDDNVADNLSERIGVISFTIPGVHPHDVAEIFNRNGIAVRAGFHCAEPLHQLFGLAGTTRISLGVYNTKEEIDRVVEALAGVRSLFIK